MAPPSQLLLKVFADATRSSPTLFFPGVGVAELVPCDLLPVLLLDIERRRSLDGTPPALDEEECVERGGAGLMAFEPGFSDCETAAAPRRFFTVETGCEGLTKWVFFKSISVSRVWFRVLELLTDVVVKDL